MRAQEGQARTALEQVSELLHRESGIFLKPSQMRSLEAALKRAAPGEDARSFMVKARDPRRGRELVQRLLDEVTVQETAFLRNRSELESIDWHSLLAGAAGSGMVRVWVPGCATGEEAYSLALLACEAFETAHPPLDVLGTDISQAALAAAEKGRYGRRALMGVEPALVERYFVREGRGFTIGEALRRPVRFQRHNLVHDAAPPAGGGPFDLIACRNVLIYFDTPTVEQVLGALEGALRPGGTLLLGAADALRGATKRLATSTRPAPTRPKRSAEDPEQLLDSALRAADEGRTGRALETVSVLLRQDPLNAKAYFVRGMIELTSGRHEEAAGSLRRALAIDPAFGPAAFTLGRVYDELADPPAARRAYEQALKALDSDDRRYEALLAQIDLGDIADACRARIERLPHA